MRWQQGLLFGIGCKNSHGLTWSGSGEGGAHGVAALQDGPHQQEGALRKSHMVILVTEDAGQDLITQSMNLWTLAYIPWFRGSLTTRTNLELLSALAGITTTRPLRRSMGFGTTYVFPCENVINEQPCQVGQISNPWMDSSN